MWIKLEMEALLDSPINKLSKCDSNITEFKKPKVQAKCKPKILTEEEYIEEMAKIIQRDFFPDLEKLKAQNDYLDAMENKDFAKMEVIRRKYSGKQRCTINQDMTPKTFETPSTMNTLQENISSSNFSTPLSNKVENKNSNKIAYKHSLDSFLQNYTSEDNQSFQEIIDTAAEKVKQKFAMLYNEEKVSAEKLLKALTLPSLPQNDCEPGVTADIVTWRYANKNSIMYIPDGVKLTKEEYIKMSNQQETIQHNNTRLNENVFEDVNNRKSSTRQTDSLVTTQANDLNCTSQLESSSFSLVKTPSPNPGEMISPLMTWGEIEGTPFRLDGSDTPIHSNVGPGFKINDTPHRETIALALAEKIGEKMRVQKQKAKADARKNISSPFIRTNIDRLASMSPAARRLATSKFGIRTPSIATPSPLRNLKACKSNVSTHITNHMKKAPVVNPSHPAKLLSTTVNTDTINEEKNALTDGLLKIPVKRLRAADFFFKF